MRAISVWIAAALLCGCAAAPEGRPLIASDRNDPFHAGVVAELNAARTDPAAYAARLRVVRDRFNGTRMERPGEIPVVTREGVAAVDEAIDFLERQAPLPALARSIDLDRAAAAHAAEQARSGATGHAGRDGSTPARRLRRQGAWQATAEAIAYGPDRPEHMVMQLIIDDGVPDRGHRRLLFNPVYREVGVGCGPHPVWRTVCVLDLARRV